MGSEVERQIALKFKRLTFYKEGFIMKKKLIATLLCTAMVVASLAGCGSKEAASSDAPAAEAAADEAAPADDAAAEEAPAEEGGEEAAEVEAVVSTYGDENGTKMEFWTFVDAHAAFFGAMTEKWNEANPDRTIYLTTSTYPYADMHTKYLMSLQAGTGAPDLCDVEVGQVPNVIAGLDTWLYNLNDAAAPYLDTMVPARMETYAGSDGNYYAGPYHVGATVMYYNLAVLEEYGITQADVDAVVTWEDYEALGKKYVEARGEEGKMWTSVDVGGTDWLWLSMAEYGDDWTGGHGGTANVQLESVSKMLKMQQQWLADGIAMTSPDGHVDLEAGFQNILDQGIVSFPKAMWYMSRFMNYMPEESGKWYIAKCPVWEEGQKCSVGIGGTGTFVAQQSANKELAAEFACWAKMSAEGEKYIWEILGFDVCNAAYWTDPEFQQNEENPYNTFFRNKPYEVLANIGLENIGKISVTAISPVINDQINLISLNAILEEGADVDATLQEAQDAIDLEQ